MGDMDESDVSSHMRRLINLLSSHRNAPIMRSTPKPTHVIHRAVVGRKCCLFCNDVKNLKNMNTNYLHNNKTENYTHMLQVCYNIKVTDLKKDKQKFSICEQCVQRLRDAYIFKKQIESSIENQMKILVKGFISKIYDIFNKNYKQLYLNIPDKNKCYFNVNKTSLKINKNRMKDTKSDIMHPSTTMNVINIKTENATSSTCDINTNPIKLEVSELIFDDDQFGMDDGFSTESSDGDIFGDKVDSVKVPHVYLRNFTAIPELDPDTLICPKCDKIFEDHESLLRHHNAHYSEFICNHCGRNFLSMNSWTRHMATHANKPFKCEKCPKTYVNSSALSQHFRKVHKGLKAYCCFECEERFGDYNARNRHLNIVHGIPLRTYVCPTCGKEFCSSSKMSVHVRRHHYKMKDYCCTECKRTFFSKNELNEHMMKHSGTRNFKCNDCGKSYLRKKTLREHLKIHANLRAHKCDICGKSFIQKCTLKSHLKTHLRDSEDVNC